MGTGQRCANDTDLPLADCKTSAIMDIVLQALGHSTDHESGMFLPDSQKLAFPKMVLRKANVRVIITKKYSCATLATSSRWVIKFHG